MSENLTKIIRFLVILCHKCFNYPLYKNKVKLFGIPYLVHKKNIQIGYKTRINARVALYGQGYIIIGENVTLSYGVSVFSTGYATNNWTTNKIEKKHIDTKVVIKDNVWIGANTVILKGVTIEEGIIVGAGSVVTSDLTSPNALYAGNPAKFIKTL
ncbi:acyltransferase [Aerococcus agrisoli]|uniref:acyltransferase n=1 Tax=Aerococcus agrisoli TaxID=2487350 RepID=UPI0013154201|nr:acyltransferase [Aerococcus agrisoli]